MPTASAHSGTQRHAVPVEWLNVKDTAAMFGVSRDLVERWDRDGLIETRRLARNMRLVRVASVRAHIESAPRDAPEAP